MNYKSHSKWLALLLGIAIVATLSIFILITRLRLDTEVFQKPVFPPIAFVEMHAAKPAWIGQTQRLTFEFEVDVIVRGEGEATVAEIVGEKLPAEAHDAGGRIQCARRDFERRVSNI
jgi:hypothetical protein